MTFDFGDLLRRLERLVGRQINVFYLGVVAEGRVPLPADAHASGLRIRWSGRLVAVRCLPSHAECRQFGLRPQKVLLLFDRGVRVSLEVEQLVGVRLRESGIQLLMRQGRSLLLMAKA